jgi:hypothetical protein
VRAKTPEVAEAWNRVSEDQGSAGEAFDDSCLEPCGESYDRLATPPP